MFVYLKGARYNQNQEQNLKFNTCFVHHLTKITLNFDIQ